MPEGVSKTLDKALVFKAFERFRDPGYETLQTLVNHSKTKPFTNNQEFAQNANNALKTKRNQAFLDGPGSHQGMWETLVKQSEIKLFSAALGESHPSGIA